jgi:hypothetical protein
MMIPTASPSFSPTLEPTNWCEGIEPAFEITGAVYDSNHPMFNLLGVDWTLEQLPVSSIRAPDFVSVPLTGIVIQTNGLLRCVSMPNLEIAKSITVSHHSSLEMIDFSSLSSTSLLHICDNAHLQRIDVPYLATVSSTLEICEVANLENLDLSNLQTTGSDISIHTNAALEAIDVSELETVGGNFAVYDNFNLVSLDAGSVTTVNGVLDVQNNANLRELNMPDLIHAASVTILNNDNVTTNFIL